MRDERNFERDVEQRRIRILILENVVDHPNGLPAFLQYTYEVRRTHVYRELRQLVAEGVLEVSGKTTARTFEVRDPALVRSMLNELRPRVANEERILANWRQTRMQTVSRGVARSVKKNTSCDTKKITKT